MTLLMANMRVPEEREGDLNASIGACNVAEGRIRKLIERYSWDTVKTAIAVNLDRTELRLREKISALPDGDYFYEDYLEFYNKGQFKFRRNPKFEIPDELHYTDAVHRNQ